MNLNKLAFSGVVVGSIAAMGCGSTNPVPDSGNSPGTDAFVVTGPPVSVTYIVSAISAPSAPSASGEAPGFNLDDKVSDGTGTATCEDLVEDFVSPTGETGVDNQFTGQLAGLLGSLADVNIQETIDTQIAEGGLLLALTVNDVNSFDNDSSVTLDLAIVKPASCAEDTCPPAGGVVTADQAWATRTSISTGVRICSSSAGDCAMRFLTLRRPGMSLFMGGSAARPVGRHIVFARGGAQRESRKAERRKAPQQSASRPADDEKQRD
jgi:hypothetical protein